jgi:hypothetical protein
VTPKTKDPVESWIELLAPEDYDLSLEYRIRPAREVALARVHHLIQSEARQ